MRKVVVFSLLFFSSGINLFALGSGGYANQTGISAKAVAHGFSFAGVADDPSAIFYNPAGLVQVKGFQTMGGVGILDLQMEHTSLSSGQKDKMASNTPVIPFFYASYSGAESPWAFGIGVNSPFGLITEWKDDSFSKYYATKSKLLMYMVNPTVSYAFDDKVSIGAGVDYFNVYDTELNSKVYNLAGTGEGKAKLSGDGDAWGYNAGLLFKPCEKHSFGVSYRSQVKVPIEGTTELNDLTGTTALAFGGSNYKTDTNTEFVFPQSWLFGYGFKPTEKLTLFADYEWVDWSAVKETKFNYDNNNSNLTQSIQRNWRATNNVGVGLEFQANTLLALRGGVLAYESAIPSNTLEASLPESSRVDATAGFGLTLGKTSIDFAYTAAFFNARDINNNKESALYSQDGKFETFIGIYTIGLSHRWGGN